MARRFAAACAAGALVILIPWGCHRDPLPPVNTIEPWQQGEIGGHR